MNVVTVGHTRTGNEIQGPIALSEVQLFIWNYSLPYLIPELFDVAAVFAYLTVRARRRVDLEELHLVWERLAKFYDDVVDDVGVRSSEMARLGLRTSIDVPHYGRSLASAAFRD
jgi:hypothetical protein